MKNLAVLAIAALLYTNSASALVSVIESCQTQNGEFKVSILSNQGIGFDRSNPSLTAQVTDKSGNVIASYQVSPPPAIQSTSFGRSPYTDTLTQGHKFSLAFPSTNFRHTSLLVQFPSAVVYKTDDIVCGKFN